MPDRTRPVTVLIVDDHEVVREGIRAVLVRDARLAVIGEARDGRQACAQAEALRPDVVIMDVSMPDMNGIVATRGVLHASPDSRVVALTAFEEIAYAREAFAAGARGYVLKRALAQSLLRAVEVVAGGGCFLDPVLAQPTTARSGGAFEPLDVELSAREMAVARLAARGHANTEIASTLSISVKTVETHKSRLMSKLGLATRSQLVRYALFKGWLADS